MHKMTLPVLALFASMICAFAGLFLVYAAFAFEHAIIPLTLGLNGQKVETSIDFWVELGAGALFFVAAVVSFIWAVRRAMTARFQL